MPARSIGSASAEIISMAKAAREVPRVAKPKPAPAILPEGKHFSRCPAAAVFDPTLTNGDLRALAAAGAFTGKDGICRAKQSTIAKYLGVFRQSVNRCFVKLVQLGYMKAESTKRANGARGPNVYRLVYPPLAEIESERPKDAQSEGVRYPTGANDEDCASGLPSAFSPDATPRFTK